MRQRRARQRRERRAFHGVLPARAPRSGSNAGGEASGFGGALPSSQPTARRAPGCTPDAVYTSSSVCTANLGAENGKSSCAAASTRNPRQGRITTSSAGATALQTSLPPLLVDVRLTDSARQPPSSTAGDSACPAQGESSSDCCSKDTLM